MVQSGVARNIEDVVHVARAAPRTGGLYEDHLVRRAPDIRERYEDRKGAR